MCYLSILSSSTTAHGPLDIYPFEKTHSLFCMFWGPIRKVAALLFASLHTHSDNNLNCVGSDLFHKGPNEKLNPYINKTLSQKTTGQWSCSVVGGRFWYQVKAIDVPDDIFVIFCLLRSEICVKGAHLQAQAEAVEGYYLPRISCTKFKFDSFFRQMATIAFF